MRVLDTYTGQFVDIDPRYRRKNYAILSHTWDQKGEQTYGELRAIQQQYTTKRPPVPSNPQTVSITSHTPQPPSVDHSPNTPPERHSPDLELSPIWADRELSPKIREACRITRENGYRYLWIDSCCIDKTSSSELSESINSMYQWYSLADVCYTFLSDVPADEDHSAASSKFRGSRWFTRGWTLQELIAPEDIQFLSQEWIFIGSKDRLADLVMEITKIDYDALLHVESLDKFSVAQRLSWAANRETTKEEDRAYSLLGIFDINMPTLYGEGERAFRRLQEEIMRRTPDQSLFAWTNTSVKDPLNHDDVKEAGAQFILSDPPSIFAPRSRSFLAPFPQSFSACSGIEALSHDEVVRRLQPAGNALPVTDYDFTPYGIRVHLPVISLSSPGYFPKGRLINDEVSLSWNPMHSIPELSRWYLVILGCEHRDFPGHLLARICYTDSMGSSVQFLHSGQCDISSTRGAGRYGGFGLIPVAPATIMRLRSSHISWKTLYIPQPERDEGAKVFACMKRHETIKLKLSKKTRDALSAQGYRTTLCSPDVSHPSIHSVTLVHSTHTISVYYRHDLSRLDGQRQAVSIVALARISGTGQVQDTPVGPENHDDEYYNTWKHWADHIPWHLSPTDTQYFVLDTPGPTMAASQLRLALAMEFAARNHYRIDIKLTTENPPPCTTTNPSPHPVPVSQVPASTLVVDSVEGAARNWTQMVRGWLCLQ